MTGIEGGAATPYELALHLWGSRLDYHQRRFAMVEARRAPRAAGRARPCARGHALPVRRGVSDTTRMLDISGLGVRDANAREAALAAFGEALLGAARAADTVVRSTAETLVGLLASAEATARSTACQALGVVLIRDCERPCLGDGGFRRIRDALIGLAASGPEVDASCLADALDEVARHREATPSDRVAVVQALATTVARTTDALRRGARRADRVRARRRGGGRRCRAPRGRRPVRDGAAVRRQRAAEREARAAGDRGPHRASRRSPRPPTCSSRADLGRRRASGAAARA